MASWTTTTHWPPDLLRVGHLTAVGLHELLDLATRMKADPRGWIDAFPGASLACFFGRPWSEAGLSVAAAAHRLAMLPVTVRPAEARLGSSKPMDDTARILSGSAWTVAVRDVPDLLLARLARAATVPVVNAWSPDHDPCQAVADLLTLQERHIRLEGVTLADAAGFTLVGTVVDIVEGSNSRTISDIRRSSRWSRSANANSPGW
jgi:ornithine carbamoyltransferase